MRLAAVHPFVCLAERTKGLSKVLHTGIHKAVLVVSSVLTHGATFAHLRHLPILVSNFYVFHFEAPFMMTMITWLILLALPGLQPRYQNYQTKGDQQDRKDWQLEWQADKHTDQLQPTPYKGQDADGD